MKLKIKKILQILLALSIGSQLSACAVVAVGAVAGSATILIDRRTPAVQAIDLGIELQANNAILQKYNNDAHINVKSFNQKILITGEAKSNEIKSQITQYVSSLKNGRVAYNEVLISPNSSYTSRALDSWMVSRIKTRMIFEKDLPSNSISIVAESGRVYLMGILTANEAQKAKFIAADTSDVKEVFVYFDIISPAEKARLEQIGKGETSQPSSPAN
jgi:osmotically-inducible protein OsmY